MLSIHTFISPMYLSYVTTFFLQFTTVTLNLSPINIYIIVPVTAPLYPSILQLYHYMPFPTCASSFCSSRVHLRHVTSSPKHHLTGQPHMPKHPLTMVLPTHSSNNPNCHFNSCNNTLLMLFQRSWMKTKKGLVVDKEF
jgi:hypothetical protein